MTENVSPKYEERVESLEAETIVNEIILPAIESIGGVVSFMSRIDEISDLQKSRSWAPVPGKTKASSLSHTLMDELRFAIGELGQDSEEVIETDLTNDVIDFDVEQGIKKVVGQTLDDRAAISVIKFQNEPRIDRRLGIAIISRNTDGSFMKHEIRFPHDDDYAKVQGVKFKTGRLGIVVAEGEISKYERFKLLPNGNKVGAGAAVLAVGGAATLATIVAYKRIRDARSK